MSAERKRKNPDVINDIRKVIDHLWKAADFVGRPWGVVKDGNNPFFGSHILTAESKFLTIVVENRATKEVFTVDYIWADSPTPYGDKIRETALQAGFSLIEGMPLIKNDSEG